jgi:tetratricopeptide (TPR) repeat protein
MKTVTPPRTPAREEMAEPQSISKKSPWKTSRKSSSKITPRETSPKQGSPEKVIKEPLKPCPKKPSDVPSPPLSPQLSTRSEVTEDDDDEIAPPCSDEVAVDAELQNQEHDTNAKDNARRREIPLAFMEAYCRDEAVADSPHMGPYLLKLAKSYATGENPVKALEYCIRAVKFYERHDQQENVLDLVISLHILASLHCHLGQYEDAVALLERALSIPDLESGGEEHALAVFSGHMQIGDTFNMVGKLAPSLQSYHRALDLQKSILGEFDPRVAGTCIYIAEAHMQALEFAEAKELCQHSLVIHTKHCEPRSMEEAADYRLLAIIYSAQGEHNKALESLVYANEIFVNFEQEFDVATGNQSIGDELLALGRDSEAFVCFGKCVSDFKMLRGEHDALVAAAYTSLAELYLRTNNPKEAKVHCQLALQIYAKQGVGHVPGDVAYGLVNIASILVQLNEKETALLLLKRAYNIQDRLPGQQATVAGLEAQIGILQNMLRQFKPALVYFRSAVSKMKNGTLKDSPLVGLVINQMGITSIELGDVQQAARFFEEARIVMECTAGPQHLDTLDVCNNLACTYIHLGRTEEAKGLLEEVVRVKEEKLGAVHPDVNEDRARLQALLDSEVGHTTTYKKSRKLVEMLTSARKAFHTSK